MKISAATSLLSCLGIAVQVYASQDKKIQLPGATGSGPYDVASAWAAAFGALYPEAEVSLTSVGSGAAQSALWGDIDCLTKPVDAVCLNDEVVQTTWGLGDAPMFRESFEQHTELQLQQFPACAGAIAVVHSREVNNGSESPLRMTFEAISGIFNTSVFFWDDPIIADLNPEVNLPHERISVVVRSDASGQTSVFTDSLGYQAPSWPDNAVGKEPVWPLGDLVHPSEFSLSCLHGNATEITYNYAADGQSGIGLGMLRVPYSIGYMETLFATDMEDFMAPLQIGRKEEPDSFVSPDSESLLATMSGLSDRLSSETFELNLATEDTPIGGYPIAGYAYWYFKKDYREYTGCYQAWLMCKFIEWSLTASQAADLALANGWVVPPPEVVERMLESLKEVQCLNNEGKHGSVIPALSYTPPPYRVESTVDKVLVTTIPVAVFVVMVSILLLLWDRQMRNGDHIWKIGPNELTFGEPPEIVGEGSFGLVILAHYRGTQVAVKRVRKNRQAAGAWKGAKIALHSIFETEASPEMIEPVGKESGGEKPLGATTEKSPSTTGSNAVLTRSEFIEDMRVLAKLRHPCITTVLGAVVDRGFEPMLVLEYMEHGSLHNILHNDTLVLDDDLLLPILQDVSQGIRFLHSATPEVIHGDLKSKNILVDTKFRAKVADFGLARKIQSGPSGTPFFMAPELLTRKSPTNTTASDVYSFGMILYEAYARKGPYDGEKAEVVLQEIVDPEINKRPPVPSNMPDYIQTIMKECLEADPPLRPCADELDNRLRRLHADKLGGTKPNPLKFKDSNVSLFDIFPRHVAEALRDGRPVEPDKRDCVTIFFSDIVGFTDLSARLDARRVADLLDRLYTVFDDLSSKYGVFKVETIGDSYMAVTNLIKEQGSDHAKRIAQFAIEAVEAANNIPIDPDDPDLGVVNLRVGFHSGPVVANVVGVRNPRYCLFGDTVNTASRMESLSETNRIQCSKRSRELLAVQFPELPTAFRSKLSVKGKGVMSTYWINETSNSSLRRIHRSTMAGSIEGEECAPELSPTSPGTRVADAYSGGSVIPSNGLPLVKASSQNGASLEEIPEGGSDKDVLLPKVTNLGGDIV